MDSSKAKSSESNHLISMSLGNGELKAQRACTWDCVIGGQASDECLLQSQAHIWNQLFSFINSMSLKCAIELGIPDIIHNHAQPMTLEEVVCALPMIHPSKAQHVHRLMRILTHSGFFAQQKFGHSDQQGYVLTHASHLLLRDSPFSISQHVLVALDPCYTSPWHYMSNWFQNDDSSAFETAHGMSMYDHGAQHPKLRTFFDGAMASDTRLVVKIVTDKCKHMFEGMNTLVDVAGGIGSMAKGIADAFPHLECTVLDRSHVVAGLEGTKNLKFLGGDMFEAIPCADIILLKWILHDWSDEECVNILKNCKEAIVSNGKKEGKVIIIDIVVDNQNNKDKETMETELFWDMEMMVLLSGKERSEGDWAKLFSCAGFSDYKMTHILGLRSLIEVYP